MKSEGAPALHQGETTVRWTRRWRKIAVSGALVALGTIAAAELLLQIASIFAPDRASSWRPEAKTRVLCVGDSHTWGGGVEREEAYPARLQEYLDQKEQGAYSVINLGLPGLSTIQLKRRVPDWLSRYQPDVMIIWAGVNNAWNTAELDERPSSRLAWLDQQLIRTRLYRLVRVRLHDRTLERYDPKSRSDRVWHLEVDRKFPRQDSTFTVKHEGLTETIAHRIDNTEDKSRIFPNAVTDFREIMQYAQAMNVRVIFVSYPINMGWSEQANHAAWRISVEYDSPIVDTSVSVNRIPREKQVWLWANHPGPAMYIEIARDIARVVLSQDERVLE